MRALAAVLILVLLSGCVGTDPAPETSDEPMAPPADTLDPTMEEGLLIDGPMPWYQSGRGDLTGTVEFRMDGGPWALDGRFHTDLGTFEADSADGGLQHLEIDGPHTFEVRFTPSEDGNLTGQWNLWGSQGGASSVWSQDTPFQVAWDGPGSAYVDLWIQDDRGRGFFFNGPLVWSVEWTVTGTVAPGTLPAQGAPSHRFLVPAGGLGSLTLETSATAPATLPAGRSLGLAVFDQYGITACRGGQNAALDQDDTDQYLEVDIWAPGSIEVWVGQLPSDCYNDQVNLEPVPYSLHVRLDAGNYF